MWHTAQYAFSSKGKLYSEQKKQNTKLSGSFKLMQNAEFANLGWYGDDVPVRRREVQLATKNLIKQVLLLIILTLSKDINMIMFTAAMTSGARIIICQRYW